ncbi:DEKNAAC100617 [Brettanomyces naardenensis]|uniref:DEKNAAC100617 n=1 Tax=Brettanomyces naardenensis TaxID=13370 RepID=A0A448YG76_BRENA|nr:DEKNAAC100617 [Brettanomyces naardenensis]
MPSSSSSRVRAAAHAGSWYTGNGRALDRQLEQFLSQGPSSIPGARVLVGPHAGYSYAGPTLAKAYGAFDASNIKRVFIMGPSHHVYFKGSVMTTGCNIYSTPLGNINVDTDVIQELISKDPKMFKKMSLQADEDEHCFEMHMPFLYKVTESSSNGVPKIIPIMLSASDEKFERKLGEYLRPYFEDKENAFIITSDFCHWGTRFGYTAYSPDGEISNLTDEPDVPPGGLEIYQSIETMDKKAMEVASTGSYKKFRNYLAVTDNTICGAKPLSVLLSVMENFYQEGKNDKFQWNGYAQSSHVISPLDSSVSYGSGYAII